MLPHLWALPAPIGKIEIPMSPEPPVELDPLHVAVAIAGIAFAFIHGMHYVFGFDLAQARWFTEFTLLFLVALDQVISFSRRR